MTDISELMQQLSEEFDEACHQRHETGAVKYGALKFMGADTFQEMIEEIVDIANYARYTYIKLRMYQQYMAEQTTPPEMLGAEGFISRRKARGHEDRTDPAQGV
jgi:hypothetical protein